MRLCMLATALLVLAACANPSYEPSSARADLEAAGLTAVQAECVTQGLDGSFSERRLDSRETPSTREQERFAEILDECGVDAE